MVNTLISKLEDYLIHIRGSQAYSAFYLHSNTYSALADLFAGYKELVATLKEEKWAILKQYLSNLEETMLQAGEAHDIMENYNSKEGYFEEKKTLIIAELVCIIVLLDNPNSFQQN